MIGIDEVGRGCWAGPLLVVAARSVKELPNGIVDSKTLSRKQRERLIDQIKSVCQLGEGWVQPEEIDRFGLSAAMKMGVCRALIGLGASYDEEIILDGNVNYCPTEYSNAKTAVRADANYPIVSAASIYAKVSRDRHMARLAKFYPFYGFEKHVGYGTELHRSALSIHGVSSIHRRSFKPIKKFL